MKQALVSLFVVMTLFCLDAQSGARKVQLGQPFAVKVGEKVVVEGVKFKVKFLSVGADSRCPEGVSCVWAGNAEVRLKIGGSGAVNLNTGVAPRDVNVGEFNVKLTGLTPRPRPGTEIDPASYEATLVVTRQ